MAEPADNDLDAWPEMLKRLADILGTARTLELADRCGGLDRIYIPYEPTVNHTWATVLTPEEWARVVAVFGGERIALPRGVFVRLRKKEIIELAEKGGASHREIALRCRVSQRYVRRVLESLPVGEPADARQLKMF